jgi:XapX domain-containing protein
MKPYVAALAIGLLVGVIYALFNVRSPAPPVIALVGLLGILIGEQLPPLLKQALKIEAAAGSWIQDQVKPHMFGDLPSCTPAGSPTESAGQPASRQPLEPRQG